MVRVRFVGHGNWRGMGFNPGAEVKMDAATAQAYVRAGQVEILPDLPAAPVNEAAAIAAKPELDRPGAPVETAAAPARERRRKK